HRAQRDDVPPVPGLARAEAGRGKGAEVHPRRSGVGAGLPAGGAGTAAGGAPGASRHGHQPAGGASPARRARCRPAGRGADPVLARREDGTVIGGHQRLLAARRLGYQIVPVIYVDLSQERARLLNLALNRIGGDWDQELLARLLADLSAVPDLDMSLSGFGDDE